MQICPQCSSRFEDSEAVCPKDGSPLVKLRPSQALKVDPLLGRRIKDTYLITSRIGVGGMGTVYKAVQERLGREVAIKVLPEHASETEEAVLRFHREARSASSLSHPNTIIIHDYGQETDGLLYLVMECVEGRTLTKLIHGRDLTPSRISRIVRQIAGSLMEAHAQGMIHRDLKPDNIMLTARGGTDDFVKVLDFGLAKGVGRADGNSNVTSAGVVMGTPAYMSPEQIQNLTLTAASDQYALGIIVFEMVSGKAPFQADSSLSLCMMHVNDDPPMLHEIQPEFPANPNLEAVLRKAMAKKAEDRFADVEEFVDHLDPWLSGDEWLPTAFQDIPGVSARAKASGAEGSRARSRGSRRPLLIAAALALILGLGAGAALILGRGALLTQGAGVSDTGVAQKKIKARKRRFDKAMDSGRRYYQGKRYVKAREAFELAARLYSSDPVPHQWLGDTEKQRGNRVQAKTHFEKYLRLSEGELAPSVLEARLMTLLGPEEVEKAEEAKPRERRSSGRRRTGSTSRQRSQITGAKRSSGTPTIDTAFE